MGIVRRPLDSGWTVRVADGPSPEHIADAVVPATVPGVVHLDLLAAGLIPDPHLDVNEALLAWIGLVDWTYETTVHTGASELAAAERHELVFDGIDTVATVLLNGTVIAEVANQHRTHRLDVTGILREGDNVLEVRFKSPVKYANAQSLSYGARPRPYPMPFEAIRKSACSFGWDWGPATFTSGIWRPVRLESWSGARLDDVHVRAEATGDGGRVDVTVCIARTADAALTLTLDVAGVVGSATVPAGATEARVSVDLAAVDRWWPVGHGEPTLYDVAVALLADGEVIDSTTRRVGFRTLRWDTEPDAGGTPFQLVVNDRPIYVKGVNWIPDDSFPSRVDRARYAHRLGQARAANLNLVRVWGGGIYESDDFYDVCDELGLLTWQDFLFACAAYPEEEPLRSEVEAEAATERGPAGAPRVAGPVHGQQREPVGSRGLGVEGAARRPDLGGALLPRAAAGGRGRGRAPRSVRPGQPVQPRRGAPQRRGPRDDAPVGAVELPRLADLPRRQAAVRRRVRLAGPADLVDPDVVDQ